MSANEGEQTSCHRAMRRQTSAHMQNVEILAGRASCGEILPSRRSLHCVTSNGQPRDQTPSYLVHQLDEHTIDIPDMRRSSECLDHLLRAR